MKEVLQTKSLAHLYLGKKGVKKGDLVDMFINNS
jgi:hypothetical protein